MTDSVDNTLGAIEAEMKAKAEGGTVTIDAAHCSGEEIIDLVKGAAKLASENGQKLKGVRLAAECFTRAGIERTTGNSGEVAGVPVVQVIDFDKMDLVFEAGV